MTEREFDELSRRMERAQKAEQRARCKYLQLAAEYMAELLNREKNRTNPNPRAVQYAESAATRAWLDYRIAADELARM